MSLSSILRVVAVALAAWGVTACGQAPANRDDGPEGVVSQASACPSNKCLIAGNCYTNGTVNVANECQSCDTSVSNTAWTNLSSSTSCTSDGLSCTTDACNGAGTCAHTLQSSSCLISGVCYTNTTANPSNACQWCASAMSTSAWTSRSSGTACTSDSLSCTTDACDGAGTCTHTLQASTCLISGACYAESANNPSNTCQQCKSATSTSAWTNASSGTSCASDGLSCTNDLCDGAGTCTHTLQSSSCLIGGVCYASGATNPLNACQTCQPATSTSAWTATATGGACADDGLSCTTDTCQAGVCTHTLQPLSCVIGGACYANGALSATGCQSCQAAVSTSAWTNLSNGTACVDDGLTCTTDTCQAGSCIHTLQANYCTIGGICYASGAFNPSVDCQSCQPATSTSAWTALSVGQTCLDDGLTCTTDVCTKHGNNTTCDHNAGNAGTVCRASAGACDVAETCTGSSTACPSDGYQAATVVCRAAAGACDKAELCPGNGPSCPSDAYQAAGYVCRAANATGCDVAETCSGASTTCPNDASAADGTSCPDDGNSCTVDLCQGGSCSHTATATSCNISGACYSKGVTNPANSCQACDPTANPVGWTFLGDGSACATDALSCTSDVCGSGLCTHQLVANTCAIGGACYATGATNPANSCQSCAPATSTSAWSTVANGAACTDDGLACTSDTCQAAVCTHTLTANNCLIGGACYANGAFNPSTDCQSCQTGASTSAWTALAVGSTCLDDGNGCTTDVCTKHGNQTLCDHNAAAAGVVCRAKQGDCDVAETCPGGGSTVCPADGFASMGTACTDDGNPCTTDTCNGSSTSCNHAAGNVGSVCRAAVSDCDLAETCTGSTVCPADQSKANGTPCTDDGNACTTDSCQAGVCLHPVGNPGALCRAARDTCDLPEVCDGVTAVCPADAFQEDGTACTDGNACTQTDQCKSGSCAGSNPVTCTASSTCSTSSCNPATGQCVDTPIASCFTASLDYVKVSVDYTVPMSTAGVAECDLLNNWSATKLNPKVDCVPQTITTLTPFVVTRMFQATCPKGTSAQWQLFTYTTSTPVDTRVEFRFRATDTTNGSCVTQTAATSSPPVPVAIASLTQDPEVCTLTSINPACPKNLFSALGGLPQGAYPCLQMDAYGVTSMTASPELDDWNVTYNCVPSE